MTAFLGLDWGTHSSKWAYQNEFGYRLVGTIWNSTVVREADHLLWFPLEAGIQAEHQETALKRSLIGDPNQPFWEGDRRKIGVALGESVVFSVLALLLDAERELAKKGRTLKVDGLTIRLSHPNWIEGDKIYALECFRNAVVVALKIFADGFALEPEEFVKTRISDLKCAVALCRGEIDGVPGFPGNYNHSEFEKCTRGKMGGTSWELVFESCAAGFPYIVDRESELFDGSSLPSDQPSSNRFRKILVIDVGAGSTDAGYLLRTIPPRFAAEPKPLLLWLPAAKTLDVAGKWLTDKIHEDHRQRGKSITLEEAEQVKTAEKNRWYGNAYVNEWCGMISGHVGEYVESIPDEVRLPSQPELEVVITGGSSAVVPMRDAVLRTIDKALENRHIPLGLREATKLIDPITVGEAQSYTEIQTAQLAVCLGASDPRLSEMKWRRDLKNVV